MLFRRPRFALPFSILHQPDTVRLVAGEDFRYTFTAPGIDAWLPTLLARLDGSIPVESLLADVEHSHRADALSVLGRLYGERAVVDGPASAAHAARARRLVVLGTGSLRDSLASDESQDESPLVVLCQDRLDFAEALDCNRRCRREGSPWLWASTGAMQRGYVGPLFLPDAGPCFGCLLRSFQRLSPAPELYDALIRQQGALQAVPFPPEATAMLGQVVRWKAARSAEPVAVPALYRLHVLECATLEVSTHRVFVDAQCPECHGGRR